MSSRATRRLASLTVAASLLLTFGMATATSSAALTSAASTAAAFSASSTATCGVGGCGRYYISYTYTGGTTVEFDYASQWQWMQDATAADLRGWRGTSSYAYIKVGDVTNSFEVQANYCASGGCFSDIINGSSSGQAGWKHKYGSCSVGYETESEALAWLYYLDAVRRVDAGSGSLAVLLAPSGNSASYSTC